MENIGDLKNEELVKLSGETVIGTPSGLRAQHAQAELTRRLIKTLNEFSRSSDRYSRRNLILSIALFFIGYLQLITTLIAIEMNNLIKIILFMTIILSIYFLVVWLLKNERRF